MAEVIGAGQNRVYIFDRKGQTQLGPELLVSSVTWGRSLNTVSKAIVKIGAAGCTPFLSDVHPWGLSLVIFRDGIRVWEGPVRRVVRTAGGTPSVEITASDVMGLFDFRWWTTTRVVSSGLVRAEMAAAITHGLGQDNPNVLSYVQQLNTATLAVSRDVSVGTILGEDLNSLVSAGGMFTTVGRSVLLWDETSTLGRLPTLTPELHLLADVEVVEDGDDLVTVSYARDDNSGAVSWPTDGSQVDPYYGLVGKIVAVGAGTHSTASLTTYAKKARASGYPSPTTIVVPSGAALRCDAPFPMRVLTPGVLVPVETTVATGTRVSATMILSAVEVTQDAGSAEAVKLTLSPLSGDAA